MKLNKLKPFGLVWGHPEAAFEQDGKLFSGAGTLINNEIKADQSLSAPLPDQNVGEADKFLISFLKEGPVSKGNIYREAEAANIGWENVKNAAAALNVQIYTQKSTEYWKLTEKI